MPTRFANLDNGDGAGEDNLLTVFNNIVSDFSIPIASKDRTHHCKTDDPPEKVVWRPVCGAPRLTFCTAKYHHTSPQPT